jgi:uncharacterized protein YbjQ (UPF0145 family)
MVPAERESSQDAGALAADSLARIEAGDIPPEAERRLAGLRESDGSFTSDLSTADFALCHQLGLRPLAQVMGSSIYQVGYQQSVGWMGPGAGAAFPGGGLVTELDTLTDGWNEARERALGRLAREAQEVGADAVIGVDVRADARDLGESSMSSGAIEYSVIGTAVRRGGTRDPTTRERRAKGTHERQMVLTELTVADYAKLLNADIEPAGIVGWSSVCFSMFSYTTAMRSGVLGVGESFELREFTQAIYAARERVMERVGGQAQALEASGIVGVRINHSISRLGQSGGNGLVVTFHAIGTAVHDTAGTTPSAPKPTIDLTT